MRGPERPAPRSILIQAPNWVGDIVMATASFADVRRTFPEAKISILLRPGRAGVLSGSPDADRFLEDPTGRRPLEIPRLAKELRGEGFDLAILFTNSFRTALLARLAGIPRRVGYRSSLRGPLLTDPVDLGRRWRKRIPEPMPAFYARLCEAAGVPPGDGRPRLHVTPECEERAAELRRALRISEGERLVGLNPGASFGASKLWPPDRFARVADEISRRWGLRTLLLVGPGEESIAREILAASETRPIYDPAHPIPLDVLKPVVRDLALLLTTDTGTRHYAVAFGVPAVVVMGPTDPRWTAYGLERTEVVRRDVPCAPCHLKTCPIDHRCMRGISVEDVLRGIETLDRRLGVFRS